MQDSLWTNEKPVQPQPAQQQHDDADRQTEEEPVAEVYLSGFWVGP